MYNINNETFRNIRKNQGFTQEEFAKKLEVSRSLVAKIEANEQALSKKIIDKLLLNYPNDINLYNFTPEITQENTQVNVQNDESNIDYKSKVDFLNSSVEFFTKMILDNNLSLLYDDNMKTIYFTASLLQYHGYLFEPKEKEKMFFYEGIGELLSDLHTGKEKTTDIIIENLTHIIRVDMFRFIGKLMWKAQKQVGFNVSYRLEDIFNEN